MSRIAIRHFCANSKFARGEAEFSGVIESSPFLGLRPMHFAGRSCFAKSSTLQVWMPQLDRGLGVGNFRSFHSCSLLVTLVGDLVEHTPVPVQRGLPAVRPCHLVITTSTYLGSNSIPQQTRSVI